MQWNELPTNIQRVLFERAASLSKEDQTLALREQIARFLHNHKDDLGEVRGGIISFRADALLWISSDSKHSGPGF